MQVLGKRAVLHPVNIALFFLVASGVFLIVTNSQSKMSQCHRLISVVNQGSSKIDQNQGKQAASTNQLAHELDGVSQNLAAVDLENPKLKEFQSDFVKVFQTLSQAIENASKALDSAKTAELTPAGREKVEKAKPEIEAEGKVAVKAAAQADILAGEVNLYCSKP